MRDYAKCPRYAKQCEFVVLAVTPHLPRLRSQMPCVMNAHMSPSRHEVLPMAALDQSGHRLGRVRFVAHLDGVRRSIDAGYPLVLVYEQYAAVLSMSYSQFARYVSRFITKLDAKANATIRVSTAHGVAVEIDVSSTEKSSALGQPRFIYDNSAAKETLV
jgi:hypothetical protein